MLKLNVTPLSTVLPHTLAAALLAVPLALSAAGCVVESELATGDTAEQYLFGLDAAEVSETAAYYGVEPDQALDQMTAPFRCEAFGDLCANVGRDAAIELVRITWDMGLDRVPIDEVQTELAALEALEAEAHGGAVPKASQTECKTYSGDDLRLCTTATLNNLVLTVQHKGKAKHQRLSGGVWVNGAVALTLEMKSERTNGNGTVTATHNRIAADYDHVVKMNYFMNGGGHHDLLAIGKANGIERPAHIWF